MEQIRVLLAEDHTIVRKGIRSLLDDEAQIEVVGEAGDGREALEKVEDLHPDIVLMDIAMPHMNGLEATRQIKKLFPEVKVIVLTMYTNEEYIFQMLQVGATGYLVKQSAPSELILAIQSVFRGDSYLSPAISTKIVEHLRQSDDTYQESSYNALTTREREILQLIAEGNSNKEIAATLHISEKTVSVHRTNLMRNLGMHKNTELVHYALRQGLIKL